MASSVPTSTTTPAVTRASSQHDRQGPPASPPYRYGTAQANGSRPTGTAIETADSDLICVGVWVAKEEELGTGTPTDEVPLLASRTVCTRHRNLSEACSDSTNHLQVVTLLENPYATNSDDGVRGEDASESSAAVCTCVVAIEVDVDEVKPTKVTANGVAPPEKRLNGTR